MNVTLPRPTSVALPLLGACALLLSGHAAAQNSGWYIGGGLGAAKANFERADFVGLAPGATYTAEDSDVAARLFGGYRLSPNWAVEFGAAYVGSYEHRFTSASGRAVYEYDASAATIAIAGNLPLSGGVSVNGRLGAAFTAAQLRLAYINGVIATNPSSCTTYYYFYDYDCTSSKTNLYWGLGVQFDVNPRWGIRLDYDNYGEIGDQFESGRATIDTLTVNVVFRF